MAPQLHLLSLGAPLLLTETGEQIRFDTRKQFALLIRLGLEAGRTLSRDYLTEFLWPDVPHERARHSLAQAIAAVRNRVGHRHLLLDRSRIELPADALDADVQHLDAGKAQIRGQFLEGFEVPKAPGFEQWKDSWRALLLPRIRDCLVTQMDAARRAGDFATLEGRAHALLLVEPLSEDAVRGMMEARAWFGDRIGALEEYGRLEARLARELCAVPTPALTRMADLLRDGRRLWPRRANVGLVAERHDSRLEAEPLIGRERELASLREAWFAIRRGHPCCVLLLGDSGLGKTTLANAIASTFQMQGAVVARAQAYEAERELPFAVLAELIRQLTMLQAIGGTDPEALSELTRVSPEIGNAFPGVPKPIDWSGEVIPLRLADAFLKVLEAASEERPLVLVIDDLHATDNASVAILHMIARRLVRGRLFFIFTARPSELRVLGAAAELVSDAGIRGLRTLELETLASDAAEELVGVLVARANHRTCDVPVRRILQASNGNPLAIELLTSEWLAHGSGSLLSDLEALNTQPVPNIGIPRAIGAVFERQIRRLDGWTRAALDLAAVLGRRLIDLPLYQVVELSPSLAGEALSRLKDEGLLREVRGQLEFRNELIRAQAYYAIATPARQELHRGVAEALTNRFRDGQSAALEVAWHFLRAAEPARALGIGLSGARAALSGGAPSEAEELLATILPTVTDQKSSQDCKLLLAKALLDQSKADCALPFLNELSAQSTLPLRGVAEVTRLKASALYLTAKDRSTLYGQAAEVALTAARRTEDPELIAGALLEFARSGLEAGVDGRVQLAAAQLARLLNHRTNQTLPNAWYALGFCQYWSYELQSACESLARAVRLLRNSPNTVARSLALNAVGVSRYSLCDFRAAQKSLTAALDLAKRIGDDYRVSLIASNLATLHNLAGRFDQSAQFGHLSTNVGADLKNHPRLLSSYMNLAEAYVLSGDRKSALRCVERAGEWVRDQRSWRANIEFLCESANIALMMADTPTALDRIDALEKAVEGREGVVPEAGIFVKLRLVGLAHLVGPREALAVARTHLRKFQGCHPLYYLEVLAAAAWLEKRLKGVLTEQTKSELGLFDTWGARGLRQAVAAQGLIE